MKTLLGTVFLCLFFSGALIAQPERSDIIEHGIFSARKTIFMNQDSSRKEVFQYLYSRNGDDSLELYNGVLAFRYTAETDNQGRVSKLVRYDAREQEDEWHLYRYKRNGSYSIEIIAQGVGTISTASYDKNHRLMEEEIESSYSLIYVRNANGKTEKILLKQQDKPIEEIARFYLDENGFVTRGEGLNQGGKMIYFSYNDKGLVSKTQTVGKDEAGNDETETVMIDYEFYADQK